MSKEFRFRVFDKVENTMKEVAMFKYLPNKKIEVHYIYYHSIVDIDDIVLMQYTGLKDKNGKKIYEGDVFSCIWSDTVGEPHFEVMTITDMTDYDFMAKLNYADEIEVIGNIYDNLELINKEIGNNDKTRSD